MRKTGWTATLAAAALLIASCRPTAPRPSENVATYPPRVEVDAPETGDESGSPQTAGKPPASAETPSARAGKADQPAQPESDAKGPEKAPPKWAESRVLTAIGRALINAAKEDAEEDTEEQP